ncbi:MAG: hypothetical protein GC190_21115 [Alphaproteobacteria bacterium]|nr:hypothetical protein [Alphaproteobacteria bacterium]
MPANIDPIYTRVGDIQWSGTITAANTSKDLSSGTVNLLFTADATNGGYVRSIFAKPLGTNVASVARFFLNNGSATTTAANNTMFKEFSLPAITLTETAAQLDIEVPLNIALPAGYCLYVLLGTAVSAGWTFGVIGGKY